MARLNGLTHVFRYSRHCFHAVLALLFKTSAKFRNGPRIIWIKNFTYVEKSLLYLNLEEKIVSKVKGKILQVKIQIFSTNNSSLTGTGTRDKN